MPAIEWKREYDVGVRKIDQQHRRIVDVLNELYDLQDSKKSPKRMQRVFQSLRDYIEEHFETEEEYIAAHGCTGADVQKREHESFVDTICSYQKDFLKQKPLALINLFNYIWDWFAHHIVVVDKKCMTRESSGTSGAS